MSVFKISKCIRKLEEKTRHLAMDLFNDLGITYSQVHVLFDIRDSGSSTFSVKDAQETLGVTQPTATGIIIRLEKGGFIKSHQPKADRRMKVLKLTKKGEDVCNKVDKFMQNVDKKFANALSKEDLDRLETIFDKITNA